ncbi:MAG: hypothetical protein P1S60_12415, partial [Anaerolineae bacterium]|nr:hypothetical protein [Anaerolineae bacterium]
DEPLVLEPVEVNLGLDWAAHTTETLGEALINFTISDWRKSPDVVQIANHWGGDLLQVWDAEDGSFLALWQLAWDSSSDAVAFYGHLIDIMPRPVLRGLVRDTTPAAGLPRGRWWAGGQGAVFLYRQGKNIVLVWGSDAAAVESAALALN